jgi:hypothetical protein
MDELPGDRFRVGVLLHPAVWCAHGTRQVRAWLRDCCEAGLILLDPLDDWRALLVAADQLIGDHGSVTAYGAALGIPVLQFAPPDRVAGTGSAQELEATRAGRLDPGRPLLPQLGAASALDRDVVAGRLTSYPGRAAGLIRRTLYRLLDLAEPGRHRQPTPVPPPRTRRWSG